MCLPHPTFTNCKLICIQKRCFFPKKTPKICYKTDIYFGKGCFFVSTTFPGHGQNIVSSQKSMFFWARNPGFLPENPFFAIRPKILSTACLEPSERRFFSHLGINFSIFRFWIMAVFIKNIGWRVEKSFPYPLWGHCPPVTALVLSAHRPFGPGGKICDQPAFLEIFQQRPRSMFLCLTQYLREEVNYFFFYLNYKCWT